MDKHAKKTRESLIAARKERLWSQQELANLLGTTQHNISRWEQGATTPSPYFSKHLCALFGKRPQELGLLSKIVPSNEQKPAERQETVSFQTSLAGATQPPSLWTVPYSRNPFFTGREELLQTLREHLTWEHRAALSQSWAISGLGGIGKTQIALEYAYRYRTTYRAIFWVSAATPETLFTDLQALAEMVDIPEAREPHQKKVLQAVKRWFATHADWLLIIDNLDDVTAVQDMIPQEGDGHILITTRAQALGALAQQIDVQNLGMAEGTLFLLRRAKLLAHDASLDQVPEAQLATAEAITIALDFFPLALDQAGAYIDEVGCGLSAYLDLYQTHRKRLLQRRGSLSTGYPESVATTWSLNVRSIGQTHPVAVDLLRFCTFLEPEAIPEELLERALVQIRTIVHTEESISIVLNEALEALRRFSLVQRSAEAKWVRVHRLVQAVLKDSMEAEEQHQWTEQVIRATSAVFPHTIEVANWSNCQRYLPQAQACCMLIQCATTPFVDEGAASLLHRTAVYLRTVALYEQAEPLFLHALSLLEQKPEPGDPALATILYDLAMLYGTRGKSTVAESLYQRALRLQEQLVGSDDLLVGKILTQLGYLYVDQGKFTEAECVLKQAVSVQGRAGGPNNSSVAHTLNALASAFLYQGKYSEAESVYCRIVSTQDQGTGLAHPQLIHALTNLAIVYVELGKYEEAEPLLKRACVEWETRFGPEHPQVAFPLTTLGGLYQKQGKYPEAELSLTRALRIWEQKLGTEHLRVSYPLNLLGSLYTDQGRYPEAEQVLQRAVRLREQAEHPSLAASLTKLGSLYLEQKRLVEAEQLLQRAVQMNERTLDANHPDTIEPHNKLALAYIKQGKYNEAKPFLRKALTLGEQRLGTQHLLLAESQFVFACLSLMQRSIVEAEQYYQQAYAIWAKTLGLDHPKVVRYIKEYTQLV